MTRAGTSDLLSIPKASYPYNKLLHTENYSLRSQFSGEQGIIFIEASVHSRRPIVLL